MSLPALRQRTTSAPAAPQALSRTFELQAARFPDRIAVTAGDQQVSYDALNRRANQVARALREAGAGPEVLVGICVERTLETVIGILGILKAGAAYVPVDPALPAETRQFIVADSQLKIFLDQGDTGLGGDASRILSLDQGWQDDFGKQSETCLESTVEPHHLAYVIYTSGSTGQPKGVQVEHRQADRLFTATRHWFEFDEQDVWTLFHSCAFDFSVWELFGALLHGGRLVVVPKEAVHSMDEFHQLLIDERVTVLNQTPSAFWQLLRVDESRNSSRLGESLRLIVMAGEPLEVQRLGPWVDRYGDRRPQLINMYGITETTVHSTYRMITAEDVRRTWSPIGVPIPDLDIHLLDEEGDPVEVGEVGEIYVEGEGVARGYLRRAELDAQRFLESPFHPGRRMYRSGDLARRLADGDMDFVGRADNQVKIRGFRIELGEIESHLNSHPAVAQSAVIAQDVEERGKRLLGYVSLESGQSVSTRELRDFLKTKLPAYKLPAGFAEVDAFPLTNNGKLNRRALPPWHQCTSLSGPLDSASVLPRTSMENQIGRLWERVLGCEEISVTADFFEQGGDSLSLMNLSGELESAFGRPFPVNVLVQTPTIEAHARLMDAEPEQFAWSPLVTLKSSGSKPPFFCVHPGGGNALCYRSVAQSFDQDRPFVAIQAYGVDGGEQLPTVEAMARAYIDAMRERQPTGPYFLGGWSFGGLVAYEMARLLSEEGAEVGALAILDAGLIYSLAVVRTLFLHDDVPLFHMSSLDLETLLPHFREPSMHAQLVPPGADDQLVANILRVFVGNCNAVSSFRPQSYSGRVSLFTASEPLVSIRVRRHPLREWSELCAGGVDQVMVPGNHLTMINPPHAETLARELSQVCDAWPSSGQT